LAGDRGGNQGGSAFLEEVDGAPGFGSESIEAGDFRFEVFEDVRLLVLRWDCDYDGTQVSGAEIRLTGTGHCEAELFANRVGLQQHSDVITVKERVFGLVDTDRAGVENNLLLTVVDSDLPPRVAGTRQKNVSGLDREVAIGGVVLLG
jgi:hypothetical protein